WSQGNWLANESLPTEGLQFLRSRRFDLELIAGRISLSTVVDGIDLFPLEALTLERVYRGLRSYIHKNFYNKLTAYTDGQRSNYTYRDLWLGPNAEAWLAATPGAVLRQGRGFRSNFIPEASNSAAA